VARGGSIASRVVCRAVLLIYAINTASQKGCRNFDNLFRILKTFSPIGGKVTLHTRARCTGTAGRDGYRVALFALSVARSSTTRAKPCILAFWHPSRPSPTAPARAEIDHSRRRAAPGGRTAGTIADFAKYLIFGNWPFGEYYFIRVKNGRVNFFHTLGKGQIRPAVWMISTGRRVTDPALHNWDKPITVTRYK
jgi:hypothetical protein